MTRPKRATGAPDTQSEAPAVAARTPLHCYDSIAEEYFAKYQEASLWGHILRERKRRLLELLAGTRGRLLDVGCGPAVMAADILDLGCEFVGVDGSPRMIAECERRFEGVARARFAVMDAEALDLPAEAFDAVLCIGVIDRLPRPERGLAEMLRVLRPGGTLVVSFPNLLSPYGLWRSTVFYPAVGALKRTVSTTTGRDRPPDLCSSARLWRPGAARRTIERLGGRVQATVHYNFEPLISPLEELFPNAATRLAARFEPLHAGPLGWLGAGFLVKAEKRP